MTLAAGTKLGPYEILAPIGAGGMGEVYRAKDAKLGREVALKVLPDRLVQNAGALSRFEREAKAVAALSHPNILSIFDFGNKDGVVFAAMELLEGETLRDRLSGGALPVRKAIDYAKEIVRGLAAAHEKGIVHRDLKPANIFLTRDGRVKILDFGLAKQLTEPTPDEANSPTVTPETEAGAILGTVNYMSPEQASGRPADYRSDIFSFGLVLYEMLYGKRAFERETAAETMAAIIRDEAPEFASLSSGAYPGLSQLAGHCLEKSPDQRFQSARDLAFALDVLSGSSISTSGVALPAPAARRLPRRAYLGLGLVGVLVLSAALAWRAMPARERPASLSVTRIARLTNDVGVASGAALSPDGKSLAFASDRSGNLEIYIRRLGGGEDDNVTDNPNQDFQPAFSPDGDSIAFISTRSSRSGIIRLGSPFGWDFRTYGGDLWVGPASRGQAKLVASNANFPVWHPSGKKIAYVSGYEGHRSVVEVSVNDGKSRILLDSKDSMWEIVRLQYSPQGNWLSLEAGDSSGIAANTVWLMPAEGGTPRKLLEGWSHTWDGSKPRLFYVWREPMGGSRLEVVDVDEHSGALVGQPRTMSLLTRNLRDVAISGDGLKLAVVEGEGALNLSWLPLDPGGACPAGAEEALSEGGGYDRFPVVSPDGKSIAFMSDRMGRREVWILDIATRGLTRLSQLSADRGASFVAWTHDGNELVVHRQMADGTFSLWQVATDGSRAKPLAIDGPVSFVDASPDGKALVYPTRVDGVFQLFTFDVGAAQSRRLTFSASEKYEGKWSPDGRFVTYCTSENDPEGTRYGLARIPAAGGKEEILASSSERLRHQFYSPDGRFIYVQKSHLNVYRMPAAGGPLAAVTQFAEARLFLEEPTISPDGRHLVYCRSNGGSSLWLFTLGAVP